MIQRHEAVSQQLREQAVATLECDVPIGWSLEDWRAARGHSRACSAVVAPATTSTAPIARSS